MKQNNFLTPYIFLFPAFLCFFFLPFFQTVLMSFFDYSKDFYTPVFTGFLNYIQVFQNKVFIQSIFNTFWFLILCVPFLVIFPLFVAILIDQKIKFSNLYKLIIYIPVVVSIVVVAIAFKWLYQPEGLLNYFLGLVHIKPVNWLTNPNIAMLSVALVTIFKGIGYYMMIYLSALMSVSKELYEACDIDGAGFFKKHLTVTIPHLMPVIALVTTISSISALKVFVEIYVMTKGGPLNSTKTIVYYIYENAFESLELGMASAACVILLILVTIFSTINILCFERDKYGL